jgi:hypothetical protein
MALTETTILAGIRDIIVMESRGRCMPNLTLATRWADLCLTESEMRRTANAIARRFQLSGGDAPLLDASVGQMVARIQAEMQL